jgi:hypothetical protein
MHKSYLRFITSADSENEESQSYKNLVTKLWFLKLVATSYPAYAQQQLASNHVGWSLRDGTCDKNHKIKGTTPPAGLATPCRRRVFLPTTRSSKKQINP